MSKRLRARETQVNRIVTGTVVMTEVRMEVRLETKRPLFHAAAF